MVEQAALLHDLRELLEELCQLQGAQPEIEAAIQTSQQKYDRLNDVLQTKFEENENVRQALTQEISHLESVLLQITNDLDETRLAQLPSITSQKQAILESNIKLESAKETLHDLKHRAQILELNVELEQPLQQVEEQVLRLGSLVEGAQKKIDDEKKSDIERVQIIIDNVESDLFSLEEQSGKLAGDQSVSLSDRLAQIQVRILDHLH